MTYETFQRAIEYVSLVAVTAIAAAAGVCVLAVYLAPVVRWVKCHCLDALLVSPFVVCLAWYAATKPGSVTFPYTDPETFAETSKDAVIIFKKPTRDGVHIEDVKQVNGQWYVFYHRSSRNSCLHRRVCADPVVILEDGSIPEVKMTSQGAGAPFGIGEKIYGRQACGLRGTLFIDLDKSGGEQDPNPVYGSEKEVLAQISEGDEAVCRYVQPETAVSHLAAEGAGSGRMEIYADGKYAGFAEMENGHVTREDVSILPGQYELAIRFSRVRDMELHWFSLK